MFDTAPKNWVDVNADTIDALPYYAPAQVAQQIQAQEQQKLADYNAAKTSNSNGLLSQESKESVLGVYYESRYLLRAAAGVLSFGIAPRIVPDPDPTPLANVLKGNKNIINQQNDVLRSLENQLSDPNNYTNGVQTIKGSRQVTFDTNVQNQLQFVLGTGNLSYVVNSTLTDTGNHSATVTWSYTRIYSHESKNIIR